MPDDQFTPTGRATTVLLLGTMVSHGFGLSLVPALLPNIESELGAGYDVLGAAVASGLLAYTVGAATASRLLAALPARTALNGTLALTGAGLLTVAAASSPGMVATSVVMLGLSAPVSWAATAHVARQAVTPRSMGLAMAVASGGAGVGVVVDGILVQTSSGLHSWRLSFVIAATIAVVVLLASITVFRRPIAPARSATGSRTRRSYRAVLRRPFGRVVVGASAMAGVASFTFVTFLTTTAIDEMGSGAMPAAALLWIAGLVGMVASPWLGRVADRVAPTAVVAAIAAAYGLALLLLAALWQYPALVGASIGLGLLNYPVWGLVAAIAGRWFSAELGVRAVSLGLVAASSLAATGNAVAGAHLEATGSMRLQVIVLGSIAVTTALWLWASYRKHG